MTSPHKTFLTSTATSVEALTVLIERSGIDITADYGDWCNIGFALAHEFGADGESFFLRISSFYPKYASLPIFLKMDKFYYKNLHIFAIPRM